MHPFCFPRCTLIVIRRKPLLLSTVYSFLVSAVYLFVVRGVPSLLFAVYPLCYPRCTFCIIRGVPFLLSAVYPFCYPPCTLFIIRGVPLFIIRGIHLFTSIILDMSWRFLAGALFPWFYPRNTPICRVYPIFESRHKKQFP